MHKEILSPEQIMLLPLVGQFIDDFGLVGGTAIALHLGHRESIDFDMFTKADFDNIKIKRKLLRSTMIDKITLDETGQLNVLINTVKFTFFQFPYEIPFTEKFENAARIPSLLTLAAMKAFALGQRAKWKDYVDMYFILKDHHRIDEINTKARELFGKEYNEKIFRTQLSYFDDINYAEKVIYHNNCDVPEEVVKQALTEFSLTNVEV
ncbi:MAG: nucleotidyl transferase AbiEii/AbiGii toxin family protein [Candidatus Vogelbacteria bacterium]|nr:nucleotidyl transferase AbiEii/AbiGii toxin family protein [Candidatus Vogelbacteria bacterium]